MRSSVVWLTGPLAWVVVLVVARSASSPFATFLANHFGLSGHVAPNLRVPERIQATRDMRTAWFDKEGCKEGLDALLAYHKDYNPKTKTWVK